MGDFTKAGKDRGDIEKELEHTLISAKNLFRTYTLTIEDYTEEELSADLLEYKNQLERFIMPLVKKAEETKETKLVNMAYDIRYLYERLIKTIQEELTKRKGG
ncbi:MAG: hypothetical protein D6699_04500 [Aquificota bacterium]|nr:MAG: hypothetical protein D6699_04500 [Aquificota bacterium]